MVELVTVTVPLKEMPPPTVAELSAMVELVTVSVPPLLETPPPLLA
jgi:hypothetical protein